LSCTTNGAFGLRERKPRTKVENCILDPNEIKLVLIWLDECRGGGEIPLEKRLTDGRTKVWGKRSRPTYMIICRNTEIVEFIILGYLVGRISPTVITKDVSNTTMTLQFPYFANNYNQGCQ